MATTADAQPAEIAGMRLGMTWAEAKPLIEQAGPIATSYPFPVPAPGVSDRRALAAGYEASHTVRYAPPQNTEIKIYLYPRDLRGDLKDPNNLIVHRIKRKKDFGYVKGQAPTLELVVNEMIGKHGPASDVEHQGPSVGVGWIGRGARAYSASKITALAAGAGGRLGPARPAQCLSGPGSGAGQAYGRLQSSRPLVQTGPYVGKGPDHWEQFVGCGATHTVVLVTSGGALVHAIEQDVFDMGQMQRIHGIQDAARKLIKTRTAGRIDER